MSRYKYSPCHHSGGLLCICLANLESHTTNFLIALDEPQVIPKATHFALAVHDLDAFLDHLRSHGVRYSDWAGTAGTVSDRADGVRQVYIQDPDEHWIEINTAH